MNPVIERDGLAAFQIQDKFILVALVIAIWHYDRATQHLQSSAGT